MTKIAILAAAMTATSCLCMPVSAETLFENWSDKTAIVRIDANGGRGSISAVPEKGEKRGRSLGTFGKKYSDLSKVKLGFNEGRLVVDTSDCDLTKPKAFIRLQFKMPLKDLPNGSKVDFIAEMKAPPGARWKLGHNGSFSEESAPMDSLKQSKKTHYWNVRHLPIFPFFGCKDVVCKAERKVCVCGMKPRDQLASARKMVSKWTVKLVWKQSRSCLATSLTTRA